MKKIILGVCILFSLLTMLAASGDNTVPIVWKNPARTFRELQCYAFGFTQNENEYKFLLQIKSLDKLLENENATLSLYLDTDNDPSTGRFRNKGWDLQLNLLLKRKTLSAIVWEKNKVKTSHSFTGGEFSVKADTDNNMLYITVKKVIYLKNIRIDKKFVLFEEHSDGKNAEKSLMDGVEINLK